MGTCGRPRSGARVGGVRPQPRRTEGGLGVGWVAQSVTYLVVSLQPPAEAVHLARMLTQSTPHDLEQRMEQVASVVRGRTEDEISVALHDNDYNPDRAVAALLDEDGGNAAVSGRSRCGVGHTRALENWHLLYYFVFLYLCMGSSWRQMCTRCVLCCVVLCRVSGPRHSARASGGR